MLNFKSKIMKNSVFKGGLVVVIMSLIVACDQRKKFRSSRR
jgi:hypothetical protein